MTKSKMNMSKILFEKDESEFSFKDETDSDTEETPETDSDTEETPETDSDTEETSETDSDTEETPETDSPETVDDVQFKVLSNSLDIMTNSINNLTKDDAILDIQNFILSNLIESKLYYKKSIGNILLSEKSSLELKNIEKDIDVINRVLTKGTELFKNFKNPDQIDIKPYVDAGLVAYKNFDSLFQKEKFIKQAITNLLVLNSGSEAEINIKEFEEMFHKELYNKFDLDYPEFGVGVKKKDIASGAFNKG